ncbi:hypothetical protein [Citrobacter sp. Cpa228]|uniref:hypothetical protein n=1 Tax=Citrobacter sp. Cpa228 TaxID=2985119 RepID=UPI002578C8ED|nr:hypothetical protein [Citrobacter sp. Cpa228]MDM2922648.1 hypothetical protein [Citrobacter sp. Cpa228]
MKRNTHAGWQKHGNDINCQSDQKSTGTPESKKPAVKLVSLNSGAGLGIDLLFYLYDL